MNLGNLAATPPTFTMATTERLPLGFTVKSWADTETVSTVSAMLTNEGTGKIVALETAPTVLGQMVTVVVDGSKCTAGNRHQLAVTFSAREAMWTVVLEIDVPF